MSEPSPGSGRRHSRLRRFALIAAGIILTLVTGVLITIRVRARRTFDAPEPELRATADSATIERGRYLAFGPAHCAVCHSPAELATQPQIEGRPPLSGGFSYPTPMGLLHFPNITPDSETGIGRYSDGQLARMLRYGVKPNGESQLPIMEYQNLSDEDIVAILSFLRSQPAVFNPVPAHELNLVGLAVKAFLIQPIGPSGEPPSRSPASEPTIERGEYLANRVAQCASCHTERSMVDFSFTGPRLAGGSELNEPSSPDVIFVPPNLTPDPATGHIVSWTEDQFVARFHSGTLIEDSPMMWDMFSHMSDTDLRAIYRYLMSLDPVENQTGPTVRPKDG